MNPTSPTPVVSTPAAAAHPRPAAGAPAAMRRQFVSFYGLKVAPAWRGLDEATKAKGREGFIEKNFGIAVPEAPVIPVTKDNDGVENSP